MQKKTTLLVIHYFQTLADNNSKLKSLKQILINQPSFNLIGVFKKLDPLQQKKITLDNLKSFLATQNFEILTQNIILLFKKLDLDADGTISYQDFKNYIQFTQNKSQIEKINFEVEWSLVRLFKQEYDFLQEQIVTAEIIKRQPDFNFQQPIDLNSLINYAYLQDEYLDTNRLKFLFLNNKTITFDQFKALMNHTETSQIHSIKHISKEFQFTPTKSTKNSDLKPIYKATSHFQQQYYASSKNLHQIKVQRQDLEDRAWYRSLQSSPKVQKNNVMDQIYHAEKERSRERIKQIEQEAELQRLKNEGSKQKISLQASQIRMDQNKEKQLKKIESAQIFKFIQREHEVKKILEQSRSTNFDSRTQSSQKSPQRNEKKDKTISILLEMISSVQRLEEDRQRLAIGDDFNKTSLLLLFNQNLLSLQELKNVFKKLNLFAQPKYIESVFNRYKQNNQVDMVNILLPLDREYQYLFDKKYSKKQLTKNSIVLICDILQELIALEHLLGQFQQVIKESNRISDLQNFYQQLQYRRVNEKDFQKEFQLTTQDIRRIGFWMDKKHNYPYFSQQSQNA